LGRDAHDTIHHPRPDGSPLPRDDASFNLEDNDMQPATPTPAAPASVLCTVGHSTRSLDELVSVLQSSGVQALVDVRSVPRSRRNPQFERAAVAWRRKDAISVAA
jgi:hypothetical protein